MTGVTEDHSARFRVTSDDTLFAVAGQDWIALHIFYSSNANPVVVELIAPLIERLRDEGWVRRYFFMRYWMDGPHIRLRLLPEVGVTREAVLEVATSEIEAFLTRRPALFSLNADVLDDLYKDMFLAEYTIEQWNEKYGEDGKMPLRDTNTVHVYEYEPEYAKYGGQHGIALAEWHFEVSSELVASLIAELNVHVRTVLLGLSIQLMTVMAFTFLGDIEEVSTFMRRYREMWQGSLGEQAESSRKRFDATYEEMADNITERIGRILDALDQPDEHADLPPFLEGWRDHSRELRDRVDEAARAGALVFPVERGASESAPVEDPALARQILLTSYMHMTNNRLGASLIDEAYLSHVLVRALTDEVDVR